MVRRTPEYQTNDPHGFTVSLELAKHVRDLKKQKRDTRFTNHPTKYPLQTLPITSVVSKMLNGFHPQFIPNLGLSVYTQDYDYEYEHKFGKTPNGPITLHKLSNVPIILY